MKPNRRSIRQASEATIRLSPQWKDDLKQKCLKAARQKRSKRVAQSRQASPALNPQSLNLHTPTDRNSTQGGNRAMIQEQFQATGVSVVSSSFEDQSNAFHTPPFTLIDTKKLNALRSPQMGANLFSEDGENDTTYITEEDLYSLMVEIEEELQRDEDAFWAEEIDLIQQEETNNERMMEEQIESFEANGCQNVHLSVPCPLCHIGFLTMDSSTSSGNMFCQRMINAENTASGCKLTNGACFGNQMTLESIRGKIMAAYEEHSQFCSGPLQFDLAEIDGNNGMFTGCSQCMKRALIAPAVPIHRRAAFGFIST